MVTKLSPLSFRQRIIAMVITAVVMVIVAMESSPMTRQLHSPFEGSTTLITR